jgi:hypothetical protein
MRYGASKMEYLSQRRRQLLGNGWINTFPGQRIPDLLTDQPVGRSLSTQGRETEEYGCGSREVRNQE